MSGRSFTSYSARAGERVGYDGARMVFTDERSDSRRLLALVPHVPNTIGHYASR